MRRTNVLVWAATIVFVVVVSKLAWAGNPVTGESLLHLLVFALPLAGIYAMSAAGLVVVYTTTGIFNFAQGAIGMFLAYVFWELRVNRGLPTWIALPLTVLVVAPLIGVTLDRLIMRHLQGQTLVVQLSVTIGMMFFFIALANMIWDQNQGYAIPAFFGDSGFHVAGVVVTWHRFITLALTVLLAIGLRALLFRTRLGVAMRAVVDNRGLAALTGARSEVLSSFSWALGCALAGLAGIFLAPESGMATSGPLTLLIITSFAAAVVGRLRSLPLTYLGALILALGVVYSQTFLQFGGRWGQLPLAIPTVLLFIVLLLLPTAELQFARIHVVRHSARVSTVRDTVLGMTVLFAAMVAISAFLSPTNMNRFALGMCTALVALSLVPLIGWAGQVSLAPLAFAGIGAVAYTRLGGIEGHWYAVLLAALVVMPVGTLLALTAMRLQGLYLALATMAFASMVEYVFFTQPFALGTRDRKVERLQLFGLDFSSTRSFLLLCTAVFGLAGIAVIALRRSALGRRFVALRDSEAASATVGVNIFETKVLVFTLSAGMAGFAGAFLAMYYETVNGQQFTMLAGLSIVLALVIGGVATVAGALFAGMFRLGTLLIQDNWHLSLWKAFEYLAPGLASFGIIQNPAGAVVPMGEGFAPLLPWRKDAKREAAALKEANAEPEVGDLGLTRPFTEADVLIADRALGITNTVPRRIEHAPLESEVDAAPAASTEPQPAAGD
jgi:branched-subunit amino acid ABC-type transport system permease component